MFDAAWIESLGDASVSGHIAQQDPAWVPPATGRKLIDRWARRGLNKAAGQLNEAQLRLFARGERRVLVILQGMDTSGKDGLIRHVFSRVNPVGLRVQSFGPPSERDKRQHYLARADAALPPMGHIAVFNRSYYEEVMYLAVHPELRAGHETNEVLPQRFAEISQYESALAAQGTKVVKFLLHISKTEHARRLLARANNPDRSWKLVEADLLDRQFWDQHQQAFQAAIRRTATRQSPWYVVPADSKWLGRLIVARIVLHHLDQMAPDFPPVTPAKAELCQRMRSLLEQSV